MIDVNGSERYAPWAAAPDFKREFWAIVRDCLTEVFGFEVSEAIKEIGLLRKRIESPPQGISGEMIYHDEPFYVACDIAGHHDPSSKNEKMEKFRAKYDSIIGNHAR